MSETLVDSSTCSKVESSGSGAHPSIVIANGRICSHDIILGNLTSLLRYSLNPAPAAILQ